MKKIILLAFFSICALIITLNVNVKVEDEMTEISVENVESLAQVYGDPTICIGKGSVLCYNYNGGVIYVHTYLGPAY